MPDLPPEIRRHYAEAFDEDARLRGGLGGLEFLRTQQILRRHLGTTPLRVADVGGATGVHSEWLLADGHEVVLVEPVAEQVARAQARLGSTPGFEAMVGNGLDLPLDDASRDAVLLMGPLYHLTEAAERRTALREAVRVVKPGGLVAAAAISRFAALLDGLAREFLFEPGFDAVVISDLRTGVHRNPDGRPEWFTTAYFHHPDDLAAEARSVGLIDVQVFAVEGPAGLFGNLDARLEDPTDREIILRTAGLVETEPALLGASPHLLVLGTTPSGS